MVTWFAVADIAADVAWVTSAVGPAWPAAGGWTYQQITGAHGTVLWEGEGPDAREEAERQAELWRRRDDEALATRLWCA